MFWFADATGETRSLSAASSERRKRTPSRITSPCFTTAQLLGEISAGHTSGDDPGLAGRAVVVRSDSAGCTEGFLTACRERNVGFLVTVRSDPRVTAATDDDEGLDAVWHRALDRNGLERIDGPVVVELSSQIDDPKLPARTRLVVRPEPLRPESQRCLFPSMELRY